LIWWAARPRAVGLLALTALPAVPAFGQVRGVYPLGMSATNSGVIAQSGLTYVNAFLFYKRDQSLGPNGEVVATGSNAVMMDLNTFAWVATQRLRALGDAKVSVVATLPIATNSLSSESAGAISGGGGLADSYFQLLILGWQLQRADVKAAYGFLAPTGRFEAGANDNVGNGYWTHCFSAGQTFYLAKNKATALSAFQLYEFHTTQEGTDLHPGQTLSLDYSLTHTLPLRADMSLQLGLVGYNQWQTTDKSGPGVTPAQAAAHYHVNAIGLGFNVLLPARKVSVGTRYFDEFGGRSTYQGYSFQITGSITF